MPEERRVVTVLFADVVGSTQRGDAVDPELVRPDMRRFVDIATEAIVARGGTVEEKAGDSVMGAFGLFQAHGDDAERALSAAEEIRDRVKQDEQLGVSLPLRFGVATGEVVATTDRSARDFLMTGDAVNIAKRLQKAAEPWQIVVAERTARSAAEFEFGPSGEALVRGKTAPVAMRVLLGRRRRVIPPTRLPLTGRADELRLLRRLAENVIQQREPRQVTIVEPAGAGKTRLVEEFLAWLPSQAPELVVVQMQPTGRDATYGPPRQVLAQLVGAIAEQTPDHQLPNALREAVAAGASHAVLVVVLEDLHLVADSALDLLDKSLGIESPASLLVIAVARPELHERRPDWHSTGLRVTRLELQPLSDLAITELVWRKAGIDTPALARLIVKRSAGNPFFASELARAAQERGSLEIPDTVRATVQYRLDRLTQSERRLLQVGSIFGQVFTLQDIAGIDPGLPDPADVAQRLIAEGLLRRGASGRLIADDIVREVAYMLLPRRERQVLHAAAARWLEAETPDGPVEVVAGHYREAALIALEFEPDSPETEVLRALAADRLRQAERGLAGAALPERTALLEQITELAP